MEISPTTADSGRMSRSGGRDADDEQLQAAIEASLAEATPMAASSGAGAYLERRRTVAAPGPPAAAALSRASMVQRLAAQGGGDGGGAAAAAAEVFECEHCGAYEDTDVRRVEAHEQLCEHNPQAAQSAAVRPSSSEDSEAAARAGRRSEPLLPGASSSGGGEASSSSGGGGGGFSAQMQDRSKALALAHGQKRRGGRGGGRGGGGCAGADGAAAAAVAVAPPRGSIPQSEIYYLIADFLSAGPCANAAAALRAEIDEHELIEPALALGAPRRVTLRELESRPHFAGVAAARAEAAGEPVLRQLLERLVDKGASRRSQYETHRTLLGGGRGSILAPQRDGGGGGDRMATETDAGNAKDNGVLAALHCRQLGMRQRSRRRRVAEVASPLQMAATGRIRTLCALRGHIDAVYSVKFDRSGWRVITGSDDMLVKIWSVHTGQLVHSLRGHGSVVVDIAISSSNGLLATSDAGGCIRVWRLGSGVPVAVLECEDELPGNVEGPGTIAFCHELAHGREALVSVGWDGSIRAWPLEGSGDSEKVDAKKARKERIGQSRPTRSVAPGYAASREWGDDDEEEEEEAYGEDPRAGREGGSSQRAHNTRNQVHAKCISCDPTGYYVAIGTDAPDCKVYIYQVFSRDGEDGVEGLPLKLVSGSTQLNHTSAVEAVKFSHLAKAGKLGPLATATSASIVYIWEGTQRNLGGDAVPRWERKHQIDMRPEQKAMSRKKITVSIDEVVWSIDDSSLVISASVKDERPLVRIYDAASGERLLELNDESGGHQLRVPGQAQTYANHAFVVRPHPTVPNILLTAAYDGVAVLWDTRTGAIIRRFADRKRGDRSEFWPKDAMILDGQWSEDGSYFVLSDDQGAITLHGAGTLAGRYALRNQYLQDDYTGLILDHVGNAQDAERQIPPHMLPRALMCETAKIEGNAAMVYDRGMQPSHASRGVPLFRASRQLLYRDVEVGDGVRQTRGVSQQGPVSAWFQRDMRADPELTRFGSAYQDQLDFKAVPLPDRLTIPSRLLGTRESAGRDDEYENWRAAGGGGGGGGGGSAAPSSAPRQRSHHATRSQQPQRRRVHYREDDGIDLTAEDSGEDDDENEPEFNSDSYESDDDDDEEEAIWNPQAQSNSRSARARRRMDRDITSDDDGQDGEGDEEELSQPTQTQSGRMVRRPERLEAQIEEEEEAKHQRAESRRERKRAAPPRQEQGGAAGGQKRRRGKKDLAPAQNVPIDAHEWLVQQTFDPIQPQPMVGERVVYIREAHQDYLAQTQVQILEPPWVKLRDVGAAMNCTVKAVEPRLADFPAIPKNYLLYTLERDSDDVRSRSQKEFQLVYWPQDGAPEFMVLSDRYYQSVQKEWRLRTKVTIKLVEGDYHARITDIAEPPDSGDFRGSRYNKITILYEELDPRGQPQMEHLSPWDIYAHQQSFEPAKLSGSLSVRLLEATKVVIADDFGYGSYSGEGSENPFFANPANLLHGYTNTIAYPMCLELIQLRLQSDYYRTIGGLKFDCGLLYENCVAFNGSDSEMSTGLVETAAKVRDALLEAIDLSEGE